MAYTVPKLKDWSAQELDRAVNDARRAFDKEFYEVKADDEVKPFLNRWFARSGSILDAMNKWLRDAPKADKKNIGERLKQFQDDYSRYQELQRAGAQKELKVSDLRALLKSVQSSITLQYESLQQVASSISLPIEDVTLPGIHRPLGVEHPIVKTSNEMVGIFKRMGYSIAEGPEIETDYYNFESLNFPPNHPARDTQDTLFVAGQEGKPQRERLLLRTHTSPVQMRAMEQQRPPIRAVVPGKVHRHDTADASHSPLFHQIEGLAVDTNITFCDLKGTLDHAMKSFFGASVKTRFYPSFFPFTEPSADVQISCFKCGGRGCRLCKLSGWIEVLGCGMVDPNVFEFVKHNGYDPARVSGFAFGMGVERIAMLKYGIDDIQLFFNGDVRFLEQFA